MSQVLIDRSLPGAETVIHNSHLLFNKQYATCSYDIFVWFVRLGI